MRDLSKPDFIPLGNPTIRNSHPASHRTRTINLSICAHAECPSTQWATYLARSLLAVYGSSSTLFPPANLDFCSFLCYAACLHFEGDEDWLERATPTMKITSPRSPFDNRKLSFHTDEGYSTEPSCFAYTALHRLQLLSPLARRPPSISIITAIMILIDLIWVDSWCSPLRNASFGIIRFVCRRCAFTTPPGRSTEKIGHINPAIVPRICRSSSRSVLRGVRRSSTPLTISPWKTRCGV